LTPRRFLLLSLLSMHSPSNFLEACYNAAMPSRRGNLLLAGAELRDPTFAQTVTLLVEHNREGALGLVLNRPTQTPVAEVWLQVEIDSPCQHDGLLYHGGPCKGPLMVLHTDMNYSQIQVTKEIYFTNDAEDVQWLLEHQGDRIRCFIGYAGWGPDQLEAELDGGSWIVTPADHAQIFESRDEQWFDLLQQINPAQAAILRNPGIVPPDPTLN